MADLSYRVAQYQNDDLRRRGAAARLAAVARLSLARPQEVRTARFKPIRGLGR